MTRVLGPDDPLGVPLVELETFFHRPGWTVRETWQADVLKYLDRDLRAIERQGEEIRERMTVRLVRTGLARGEHQADRWLRGPVSALVGGC